MSQFKVFIIIIFIVVIGVICGLSNFKQETLHCSKIVDLCKVEKTNLFGMKSTKKIIKYSDIKTISYSRQKVKGNLYAKGYTDYQLYFLTKNNNRKYIFSGIYLDLEHVKQKYKEIKHKLKTENSEFSVTKD